MKYKIGQILDGVITGIQPYGACSFRRADTRINTRLRNSVGIYKKYSGRTTCWPTSESPNY